MYCFYAFKVGSGKAVKIDKGAKYKVRGPSRLFVTLLQRDALVGHAEAIRTQSRKPSKAHTHKKRQTNAGQPHSTRRKEATPQLGATHAATPGQT